MGQLGDGEPRGLGVGAGRVHGVGDGAVPLQNLQNLRVRDAGEAAFGEHRADGLAVGPGAALQRVDDGQRRLALAQVAGHRLAQDVFGGGQVQHVVHDLEGQPQVAPILTQQRFGLLVGVGNRSAQLHGDAEQARRLAEDQVEVLLFVDQVAQLLHLQQLALHHLLGQRDQQLQHSEVAFLQRGRERLHVEPVAGQHALGIAPCGVGRGPAAPRLRLVDDVVVHQRRGVQHLDDRTEADARVAGAAQRLGREKQQQRTDALPAARHQVLRDVGDNVDV